MKTFSLTLVILILIHTFHSFGQTTFQKVITDAAITQGWIQSINKTVEGGYILTGNVWASNGAIELIKMDSALNITWFKKYGYGTLNLRGDHAEPTSDSGFIIHCFSSLPPYSPSLIKTNSTGDTLWTKSYTGPDGTYQNVVQTADNGYLMTSRGHARIVKLDSLGNLLWSRKYTYSSFVDPYGAHIEKTDDGGFIYCGSFFYTTSEMTYILIKLDAAGNTLWIKEIDVPGIDEARCVKQAFDGGYIIGGWNMQLGGAKKGYVVKTDSAGNFIWSKIFGTAGDIDIHNIDQTTDGGFIIVGESCCVNGNSSYAIKFNAIGDTLWTKAYRYGSPSAASDVLAVVNDKTLIAGYTFYNSGGYPWLAQIDTNGNTGCDDYSPTTSITTPVTQMLSHFIGIDTSSAGITISPFSPVVSTDVGQLIPLCPVNIEELNVLQFSVFPNPFTTEISMTLEKQNLNKASFIIKNVLGQTVFFQQKSNLGSSYTKTIDLSFLSKGIYLLDVRIDGERTVKKIVKE